MCVAHLKKNISRSDSLIPSEARARLLRIIINKGVKKMGASKRSEEHTSELQSLMRISYAVFCLKKKRKTKSNTADTLDNHQPTHHQKTSTNIVSNAKHHHQPLMATHMNEDD